MRFCRHDWYIHKTQRGFSLKHEWIIGDECPPIISILVCYGLAASLLNLVGVAWYASITGGLPISFVLLVVVALIINDTVGMDYDPWKAQDKSCLKCGKIEFTATKNDSKIKKRLERKKVRKQARQDLWDARQKKLDAVAVIRTKNVKLAGSRYKKMLELYQRVDSPSRH